MSGLVPGAPDGSDLPSTMQGSYKMMRFASANATAIVGHFEMVKSIPPPTAPAMAPAPMLAIAAESPVGVTSPVPLLMAAMNSSRSSVKSGQGSADDQPEAETKKDEKPAPKTKKEFQEFSDQQKAKGDWYEKMTKLPPKGSLHEHHLLPQEFRAFFEKLQFNIEEFKVWLSVKVHLVDFHGGAKGGGLWNETWSEFISKDPATRAEFLSKKDTLLPTTDVLAAQQKILAQLEAMKLQWDVTGNSLGKGKP